MTFRHQLLFRLFIIVFIFIECQSLKCYHYATEKEEENSDRMDEQMCRSSTRYCLKMIFSGRQVAGSCEDTGQYCTRNGCTNDEEDNNQACCCDTNLCNSAMRRTATTITKILMMIFAIIRFSA
jgi:hypothetical protein